MERVEEVVITWLPHHADQPLVLKANKTGSLFVAFSHAQGSWEREGVGGLLGSSGASPVQSPLHTKAA